MKKNSYYYWKNKTTNRQLKTAEILRKILEIYRQSKGLYGAGKIQALLAKENERISRSTVSRYMNILGIRSVVKTFFKKRKSSMTEKERQQIINRIKELEITRKNQVWTTDISYLKTTQDGTVYFISFIDLWSRKVVAWDVFKNQKTDTILSVLKKAIKNNQPTPGLIIHSDKGSQMRSKMYRDFLEKYNFVYSYTSLDHSCDENAIHESFHAQLKKEKVYLMKLKTLQHTKHILHEYIDKFYNNVRIQACLKYLSPMQFEQTNELENIYF